MTAVVRHLRRTATVDAKPTSVATAEPSKQDALGGECLCGRGPAIGTCVVTANRLWFRAFHEQPAAYHLQHVTDWACVDCIADHALDVANGVVRERMREMSRKRAEEMTALMRQNEMRRAAGLPIVPGIIPEGNEWPSNGQISDRTEGER